jgi:hypothetical protein
MIPSEPIDEKYYKKLYNWNNMVCRRTPYDQGWEWFDPAHESYISEGWYSFYDDCSKDLAVVKELNKKFGKTIRKENSD